MRSTHTQPPVSSGHQHIHHTSRRRRSAPPKTPNHRSMHHSMLTTPACGRINHHNQHPGTDTLDTPLRRCSSCCCTCMATASTTHQVSRAASCSKTQGANTTTAAARVKLRGCLCLGCGLLLGGALLLGRGLLDTCCCVLAVVIEDTARCRGVWGLIDAAEGQIN